MVWKRASYSKYRLYGKKIRISVKNIIILMGALGIILFLSACAKYHCLCKSSSAESKQSVDQADATQNKKQIKTVYKKTAKEGDRCDFGGRACACSARISQDIGYSRQELDELADANLGLGCGNPISLGEIKPGKLYWI